MECDSSRKQVLKWRHELNLKMTAEGHSPMAYLIELGSASVKLTVTHEIAKPGSKLIGAVSNRWSPIRASLKSLLETGHALEAVSTCAAESEPTSN